MGAPGELPLAAAAVLVATKDLCLDLNPHVLLLQFPVLLLAEDASTLFSLRLFETEKEVLEVVSSPSSLILFIFVLACSCSCGVRVCDGSMF
jgi:hypothetical protein